MFVDRTELVEYAPPISALNTVTCAWICFSLCILLGVVMIYQINVVCMVAMHSGMFAHERIDDETVWNGSHDSHDEVVDVVLREALHHRDTDQLMEYLASVRGQDPSEECCHRDKKNARRRKMVLKGGATIVQPGQ